MAHKKTRFPVLEFVVDPNSEEFKAIEAISTPGHPHRCLIGTLGNMKASELGQAEDSNWLNSQVFVHIDEDSGEVRWSYGDFRFFRPAKQREKKLARNYDLGHSISRTKISLDPGDPTVTMKARERGSQSGPNKSSGNSGCRTNGSGTGNWRRAKALRRMSRQPGLF